MNINLNTKIFEEKLIKLINESGLPEINVFYVLKSVEVLVELEFNKKIAEETAKVIEEQKTEKDFGVVNQKSICD